MCGGKSSENIETQDFIRERIQLALFREDELRKKDKDSSY